MRNSDTTEITFQKQGGVWWYRDAHIRYATLQRVKFPRLLKILTLREETETPQTRLVSFRLVDALQDAELAQALFRLMPESFGDLTFSMGTKKYGPVCPYHKDVNPHPNTLTVYTRTNTFEGYVCPVCHAAIDIAVVTEDGRKIKEVD
jgi:hypothetical protein